MGTRSRAIFRRAPGAVRRAAPHRLRCDGAIGFEVVAQFAPARGLLRLKGSARGAGWLEFGSPQLSVEPAASPSCTRAALRRSGQRRRCSAGSARCIRWSAGAGTSTPRSPLRSSSPLLIRAACAGRETFVDLTAFPACIRILRSSCPPTSAPPRCAAPSSPGAASCSAQPSVFDLYEGEQLGVGRKSLTLRLEFRAADRTLTDDEIDARCAPHRDRSAADRRDPPWLTRRHSRSTEAPAARVLVAGAAGFTGALAAQIVWRHPRLELVAASSRSDAGSDSTTSTRAIGSHSLTELDLRRLDGLDAAIVAYPHGAAAPIVAALRRAGAARRRPLRRFPSTDMETYERWYGEHGAPDLFGEGVYGLTELHRDELREAELVATPGCYPTATVLALAPLAERGLIADVVDQRDAGDLRLRAQRDDLVHFSAMTENAFPYRTGGHRHRPEIEQELAAFGSPAAGHLRSAPASARPGRAGDLLRETTEPISAEEVRAPSTESAMPGSPSSVSSRPTGPARAPRHERVPGLRDARGAGAGAGLRGDRQLWKGASGQGGAEPQPDARPRGDGGAP